MQLHFRVPLAGVTDVLISRDADDAAEVEVSNGHVEIDDERVALRRLRLLRPAAEAAEAVAEELGEDVAPAEAAAAAASALLRVLLHALLAVAIVDLSLLRVAQHLVRVADVRELARRLFVPGVLIGVILQSQLAVGALDLVVGRPAIQAQGLVIVRSRRDRREGEQENEREASRGERTRRHRGGVQGTTLPRDPNARRTPECATSSATPISLEPISVTCGEEAERSMREVASSKTFQTAFWDSPTV